MKKTSIILCVSVSAFCLGVASSGFAQMPPPGQTAPQPAPTMPPAPGGHDHARAPKGQDKDKSKGDRHFVMEATHGGMKEVAAGRAALERSTSEDVKQFAQRIVDDHTKANDELKALASSKNITIPDESKGLHHPTPPNWESLKGVAFDRVFMADQVRAHEKTIALFERQAKSGADAELKSWAEKTLPALREHLKMARDVRTKVNGPTN